MPMLQPTHSTFYVDWENHYKLLISPLIDTDLENLRGFSFYKQIDKIYHGYFYAITKDEYMKGRQEQRNIIHKEIIDKVYNRKELLDNNAFERYLEKMADLQADEENIEKENTLDDEIQQEIDLDIASKDAIADEYYENN